MVSFVYLPVECPFYKFYRINCRPKSGAKLLDRFFHRRRQVSPVIKYLTHRFFDGYYHLLDGDLAVSHYHGLAYLDPLCPFNTHSTGTSAGAPLFLINNTRNFAGLVLLAFRSTT